MRRILWGGIVVLLAAGAALALLSRSSAAQGVGVSRVPHNRYIVVLKEDAGDVGERAAELARAHGLILGRLYRRALRGFVATIPRDRLALLRRDPRVAYVERDRPMRAFASFPVTSGVDRVNADASATAKIDGIEDPPIDVDIAIVDTGIQRDHPDLNVVGGRNFVTFSESDDRVIADNYDDLHGHGTHVAGTVAAKDDGPNRNGIHVVGMAPGARLWAVRVLDQNSRGWTSWMVAGFDWLADTSQHPPIEVANMSLGGDNSQVLIDAVARVTGAGVTCVIAAGNSAEDCASISPANSRNAGVITVSAIADYDGQPGGLLTPLEGVADKDDTFASFSNFGAGDDGIDIAAPGVAILSTYPGSRYRRLSGTSMAAPHVTGAAALYIARHGGSPIDVKAALLAAARSAASPEGYRGGSKDNVDEPVLDASGF